MEALLLYQVKVAVLVAVLFGGYRPDNHCSSLLCFALFPYYKTGQAAAAIPT